MADRNHTAAFTGKRPQGMPWGYDETDRRCVRLKARLRSEIVRAIRDGYTHFISGMALGVDMWAAELVLELKSQGHSVTLEAALPCSSQAQRWNAADRKRHERIVSQCDTVTCLSERYTYSCMFQRNRYMVDHASLLIAVTDGDTGGTGQTVAYARRKKVHTVGIELEEYAGL